MLTILKPLYVDSVSLPVLGSGRLLPSMYPNDIANRCLSCKMVPEQVTLGAVTLNYVAT